MAGAPEDLSQTISLIRKAREGDATAVNRLFDRYSRFAVECARRSAGEALKKKEEVEDLAQSALAEVWRDFRKFDYRGIGSLDRFVKQVVEHKVMKKAEYWGAQRRNAKLERPMQTTGGDLSETARIETPPDPLTTTRVVVQHETQERVREAIGRLPEEHATPLQLHFLDGLSLKEVAERLSLPSADAARMRVQRAREAMRLVLEGNKGGGSGGDSFRPASIPAFRHGTRVMTPSAVLRKLLALVRRADRVVAGWIGGRAESPRAPSRCSADRAVDHPADDPVESPADRERLRKVLERLPKEHAILLRWVFLDGLTMQEVAVRLSLRNTEAARKRLQRALHAVRKRMQGDLEGPARDPEGGDFPRPKASGLAPSAGSPAQAALREFIRRRFRIAIERLPERLAIPLRLCMDEGLSAEELADRLQLGSASAARRRIARSLRALRKLPEWPWWRGGSRPEWGGT